MPLYEYECKKCGQVFEAMQKFSDEPLKKHPVCGGKVFKLMSAPGFQFKGTGWYVTDYAKAGSGAPASEKGESPVAASSDAKPAASTSETSPDASSSSDKPAKGKKKK